MEKTFTISRATLKNLDTIAPLFNSYRIFYGKESNINGATRFIHDRLIHDESVIFIAVDQNAPSNSLGFVQLYPSFSSVSMNKIWILNDLFVEQFARKQGVGLELMKTAETFATESGAKCIVLETAEDNKIAQRLYESIGYKKENEYYNYSLRL